MSTALFIAGFCGKNSARLAMVYSKRYNYIKFPGGGIEAGENQHQALIREVKVLEILQREETHG